MSYNGSGTFQINTSGQPVVTGTVISSTAFNALTADLATGLSTAITKDGQTATTARIPFAAGISSTLVTDSSSTGTGSIITAGGAGIAKALYVGTTANIGGTTDSSSISTGTIVTAGGVGIAKNLYVGANANIAGTLDVTGTVTVTNPVVNNIKMGYTTTATAGATTTLTISSNYRQFFTGVLSQTIVLPVTSTLVTGIAYEIENNSTGTLTVNSSGGNLVGTIPAGVCAHAVCIGTTLTTAADWDWDYISNTSITGTGSTVLANSPTLTSPVISTITNTGTLTLPTTTGTIALTSNIVQIQPISASVAASALTITASALNLDFRSTTLGSGTVTKVIGTPANLVISSGSTLGTVNATQSRIVVIALNNAGTIELAAVNISGGNQLDETNLITTTAEGGAGAADSANVIYSTTARTSVAYRVIGYIESTQATAGTWATAPSTIQGYGGQALNAMSSVGYGQTWQLLTGSRAIGTTYYNTTGKPIMIAAIFANNSTNQDVGFTVNGVNIGFDRTTTANTAGGGSLIVPPGATYVSYTSAGTLTLQTWNELR